ncbi:MAG: zinc ribbon domain-containing protein [Pseudomonadota bacterium]
MTPKYCPNMDCRKEIIIKGPLEFCDECGRAFIVCSNRDCSTPNHISAVYCKACGQTITTKNGMIQSYKLRILDDGEKRRGLFVEYNIKTDQKIPDKIKMADVYGSLVVFTGDSGGEYNNLYLIHPLMNSEPINITQFLPYNSTFSGFLTATNKYIFLGSNHVLYRIGIPSVSTAIPSRIDLKKYNVQSSEVYYLSENLLLLRNESSLALWDIEAENTTNYFDFIGGNIIIQDDTLLIAQSQALSFLKLNKEEKILQPVAKLNLAEKGNIYSPCYVCGKLYAISQNSKALLLKWNLGKDILPINELPKSIKKDGLHHIYNVGVLPNRYLLQFNNHAEICDSNRDMPDYRFDEPISQHIAAKSCGILIALPFINPIGNSIYISLINAQNGKYVFSTDSFSMVYADPVLWGPYFFVLAKKNDVDSIKLYGYDLMRAKRDSNDAEA